MLRLCLRGAAIAALALTTLAAGAGASGTFVQGVHVLHTFHGPTTGKGAFFGWAVSELRDVDGDGATDVVIGEVDGGSHARGRVWVYSGRPGRLLFRHGDAFGAAVSSAGDVNGDGVSDLLVGAPGTGRDAGRAYVISGRTHRVIRVLSAGRSGDEFGDGVAHTADLSGDGVPDLIVGA